MEIPTSTQRSQQQARTKNLYDGYNELKVPFHQYAETRFEGHYDEPTGYSIFVSDPITVKGLENPVEGTTSQRVIIQQRVHGKRLDDRARITVSAVTNNGTYEMFQVNPSGVEPPNCTELAQFILANISPHTSAPMTGLRGSTVMIARELPTATELTDNMSHDIDAPWYQGRL